MTLEDVAARFDAKREGDGYRAHCPAHKDRKSSLTLKEGRTRIVLRCHAGCAPQAVLDAVGLTFKDLSLNGSLETGHRGHGSVSSQPLTTYIYRDAAGVVRYRKQRTATKRFFFEQPAADGTWIKRKPEGLSLLYRINELRGHTIAYICEGEKDADRLWALGLPATTIDAGASEHTPKWTDAHTAQLVELGITAVACFPDNDPPGRAHMHAGATSCVRAGLEARIVALPGLPEKGDVSDYLASHTAGELLACVDDAPRFALAESDASPQVETLPQFLARIESRGMEVRWRVEELIPEEGIVLFHGQPRDLKSFCSLEVGLALASGRPAFNCPRFAVSQPVRVAYFTEEDAELLLAVRLKWLTAKTGVPELFYPFAKRSFNFDDADTRSMIRARIVECRANLAQFDPLRSYTGLSDKGPADFRPIAAFLREIQSTTTAKTIQLVHHDVKPSQTNGTIDRRRSQNASGGGIFAISDCPVGFAKLDWNKTAVYPEDYKLSSDPKPFEVTFETAPQREDERPQFSEWITPIARTQDEHAITAAVTERKVLAFLRDRRGEWFTKEEVAASAHVRKESLLPMLEKLLDARLLQFATGQTAKQLGRNEKAKLYAVTGSGPADQSGDSTGPPSIGGDQCF